MTTKVTSDAADVSVRPATTADVAGLADVQVRVWREAYGRLLPPAALAALDATDVEGRWREAVESPPSDRHAVLVALEHGRLAGFAAVGPVADELADPDRVGELHILCVLPDRQGHGHGSRLLTAGMDILREAGFATAVTWVFDSDAGMTSFLDSAGWALDGARRDLQMDGDLLHQVRLHTALR